MIVQKVPDGFDSYIQKWRGMYRHINFTVCFHTAPHMQTGEYPDLYPDEGIWNGYIQINRKQIPKEFDSLIPKIKQFEKRKWHEYGTLEQYFDIGITFFQLFHDADSKIIGFEVGNDYNHLWNHGSTMNEVEHDMKRAIDRFIDHFPKYKAWSFINGMYVMATRIEAYNRKKRLELK